MEALVARRLHAWLQAHDGVVTRRQAQQLGISPHALARLVRSGRLERFTDGVFVDGAMPPNPRTTLRAALGSAGRDAVVSHRSAAWLWDMVDHPPAIPTLTVPFDRRVRRPHISVHQTTHLPLRRRHRGFPLTDPARTILDLAGAWPDKSLDLLVDRALSMRLVTTERLQEAARSDPEHRRAGSRALRQRLAVRGLVDAPRPSVLESHMSRLLERLVRRGTVPPPQRETAVLGGRFRLDFSWPTVGLAVEVDRYVWHADPSRMGADHERRNRLCGAGWTLLVYTWAQVMHDAEAVMAQIEVTYQQLASAQKRSAGP